MVILDESREATPPALSRWAKANLRFQIFGSGLAKTVGFLGVLGGLIFAIVYIINNWPSSSVPPPEVTSLSRAEVAPEEEVHITGKNLGAVSEAHLVAGLIDERILYLPVSDSRLIVNVPQGVGVGIYDLELRVDGEDGGIVAGQLEVTGPPTPTPSPTPLPLSPTPDIEREPIVFADLNWDSAQIQNAISRFIIEHGFGYPTDAIFGGPIPLWKSIFEGNIHVLMEALLPNYQSEWEKGLEEGSIIPLGKSLDDNWQSGFVIPTYVAEANPGLKSVSDLPDYREIFATGASGGRAVLVTCLVVWECSKINNDQVRAYGLEEVIELKYPASQGALFASLENAYENREPWLGYLWGPTQIASKLELTRLEEPPYSESCWDVHKGCAYPTSRIRIVVNPGLLERAPQVMEFLRKWDLNTATQVTIENQFAASGSDLQETVLWFLTNNEAVWIQWVPHDVFVRVRDAVKDQ